MRRTKIVASIGPASWDEPVLRKVIAAGADVIRINLSHGEPAAQLALDRPGAAGERATSTATVGVLVDLPGPKLRMAPFPDGGVQVAPGDRLELRCGAPESGGGVIGVDLDRLGLLAGDRVVAGDGGVVLEVVSGRSRRRRRPAPRRGRRPAGRAAAGPARHPPARRGRRHRRSDRPRPRAGPRPPRRPAPTPWPPRSCSGPPTCSD